MSTNMFTQLICLSVQLLCAGRLTGMLSLHLKRKESTDIKHALMLTLIGTHVNSLKLFLLSTGYVLTLNLLFFWRLSVYRYMDSNWMQLSSYIAEPVNMLGVLSAQGLGVRWGRKLEEKHVQNREAFSQIISILFRVQWSLHLALVGHQLCNNFLTLPFFFSDAKCYVLHFYAHPWICFSKSFPLFMLTGFVDVWVCSSVDQPVHPWTFIWKGNLKGFWIFSMGCDSSY